MTPEIFIYDEIGPEYWGLVSSKVVIKELDDIDPLSDLTVRINSPGGDVNEAFAIYNALNRRTGKTIVEIDAVAASAASYVAMAGDEINMAENALMMIHNAWTIAYGDSEELRKVADTLDKYTDNIASSYASRSGMAQATVLNMMVNETWLTASEAVDKGFADSVSQPLKVAAKVRPGQFKNMPHQLDPDLNYFTKLMAKDIERRHKQHERELQLARLR